MLTKEFESELKKWRHDFHASPELNFDVNQTAAKVAELLKALVWKCIRVSVEQVWLVFLKKDLEIKVLA